MPDEIPVPKRKKTKKDQARDLRTIFSVTQTAKFAAPHGGKVKEMGRWCEICRYVINCSAGVRDVISDETIGYVTVLCTVVGVLSIVAVIVVAVTVCTTFPKNRFPPLPQRDDLLKEEAG